MYKSFLKRAFDVILSLIALPFFGLIYIVVAPLIYFGDKGPVFYNGDRLGKNGRFFSMYKFRSMRVNAPDLRNADGSTYNSSNDSRVTKIGRIIRKTSIDETPQLLNVLKGDMSLIGPRAHLTTRFKDWDSLTDIEKKRLSVRPGITGYSQAYFRNSATTEEKNEQDCYYVDHMSLLFDIKIIFKTVQTVIFRKNIYSSEGTGAVCVYSSKDKKVIELDDQKTK